MTQQAIVTPVVLCVYNRPEKTQRVLDALKVAKPRHVLVIADGPKKDDATDSRLCKEVLQIIDGVDWDAKVDFNVSPVNLGCRKRIQTGLSWSFDLVEQAIILEDDCIPSSSFFPFCEELLQKYRDDKRVGLIGGANFQFGRDRLPESYYFSRYPLLWGWACWRRTWDIYDADLTSWNRDRDATWLSELLADPLATAYWTRIFDRVKSGLDTWDYSLVFSCWRSNLLAIQPSQNMIENIGFGKEATHTLEIKSIFANIPAREINFPLNHPFGIERNVDCDAWTEQIAFSGTARKRLEIAERLSRLRH
jgi:glycosyltransferase involved in cell wall biosynthesis